MPNSLCDVCEQEEGEYLFGMLNEGSNFVGRACMARAGLEIARAVLPPEEIAEFLGPMFVNGGAASKPPPKRATRNRKGAGEKPREAAEEPEAPQRLEEPPATAQDA